MPVLRSYDKGSCTTRIGLRQKPGRNDLDVDGHYRSGTHSRHSGHGGPVVLTLAWFTVAPASNSARTTSRCPSNAAANRAVEPSIYTSTTWTVMMDTAPVIAQPPRAESCPCPCHNIDYHRHKNTSLGIGKGNSAQKGIQAAQHPSVSPRLYE
jgi:hypothetical protein